MFLANVSIKRPVFITVIFIVLFVIGIISYQSLTINDMPQTNIPNITVTVAQRGASPDQMETKVTKIIEEAVGQISGVKHISSTISEGISNTVVEFSMDKSTDSAAQDVREKVGAVRGQLPQDIDEPVISKLDSNAEAIISLAVSGPLPTYELSQLVNEVAKKKLSTINGVGAVEVYGDEEREIHIKLDNQKLAAYELTTVEVINSLQSDNIDMQAGIVSNGDREISLSTNSTIMKVEDFNAILIAERSGSEIRVRDIAEVSDGIKDKDSLSFYQGKNAIGIDVIKQSGANTVSVADEVKRELISMQKVLPLGVKIDIVRDNSKSIRDSVDGVMKTIIDGCILAIIIVFIFLNNWESTLISAISIPISIVTTFIAMNLMKFSLNTMSMMALSLSVGLLIDDGIVVIENIARHLHMGKPPIQAAKEATSEIGLAVLATTMSVVVVFLPVALVSGFVGKLFIEFGLTVVFSMLVSLFVSFTLVPMMSSRMLKSGNLSVKSSYQKVMGQFNRWFDKLAQNYSNLLGLVLKRRLVMLALSFVIFIGSISLVPLMGFTLLPSSDLGEINVTAELDSGLSLEAAAQKAKELESIANKYPEVQSISTSVTKDEVSLFIKISDKKDRKDTAEDIVDKLRTDLRKVYGIELAINASSMAGGGGGKAITLKIRGDNYDELQAVALEAKQLMNQDPHARDVSISYKAGKLETQLDVDRDKAADLGVNAAAAADTLSTLFDGAVVSKFSEGKDRYDVRVSMKDEQRKDLKGLNNIYLQGSNDRMVALDQVTHKVLTSTASTLYRHDRRAIIEVSANVVGVSAADFTTLYIDKLKHEVQMPKGVSIESGDDMIEGFSQLVVALGLGILCIFLVMAAQFESYIDPISIMFALPMAVIGAILGLLITGNGISIMSLIGVIMLMGLVAKNAILLIDYTKQKRSEGIEKNKALIEAGLVRLRPILMTSFAMIFGMLPSALAKGTGAEMYAPMADAIIGGLITSTVLTLFVVPVVYSLLDDFKCFFKNKPLKTRGKELA